MGRSDMHGINRIKSDHLVNWDVKARVDEKWVNARPYGMGGIIRRFKMSWLVFSGKADVLEWYKQ